MNCAVFYRKPGMLKSYNTDCAVHALPHFFQTDNLAMFLMDFLIFHPPSILCFTHRAVKT